MAVMHVQKRVIKSHASGHELSSPLGSRRNFFSPKYSNIQSSRYVRRGFSISWLGADYMEQQCDLGLGKCSLAVALGWFGSDFSA